VKQSFEWRLALAPFLLLAASGCVEDQLSLPLSHPSVAPAAQPAASLKVDASQIRPMYDHRLLAVDLPSVVRVAMARNIDIKEAQQTVEASHGVYESSVGAIFPSLTPNITALGIQGAISSSSGLAVAAFTHFFPAAAVQWIINPGQVAYNVIASEKRLEASEMQDRAVVLETTRAASVQYYVLALNQAQVSVAWQAIKGGRGITPYRTLAVEGWYCAPGGRAPRGGRSRPQATEFADRPERLL
jgi:outer membrane protein TolC